MTSLPLFSRALIVASSLCLFACAGAAQAPRDTTQTGLLRAEKDNMRVGMIDDDGTTTTHTAAASRTRSRTPTRSTRASGERPPRGPHQ